MFTEKQLKECKDTYRGKTRTFEYAIQILESEIHGTFILTKKEISELQSAIEVLKAGEKCQ